MAKKGSKVTDEQTTEDNDVASTGSALDDLDLVAATVPTPHIAGEPGEYYIAENGVRVSVQSWTEHSTAKYALEHPEQKLYTRLA
jgi:hypothetical protein